MTDLRLRIPKVLALTLLISVLPLAIASQPAAGSSGFTFTTFELGRFDVPGKTCPGSTTYCWNVNAEPQIRADRAGNFYATSEYLPRVLECSNGLDLVNSQCGGTGAWKSSDNGLHYKTLPSPNSLSSVCPPPPPETSCSLSPYGGDTDLATAPVKNVKGFYNVYVVSLERATGPLLTVEESTSIDGGASWGKVDTGIMTTPLINPLGSLSPVNDRPWVAADRANKVCVSTHNVATDFNILVSCSYDAGLTFGQTSSAFDATHSSWFLGNTQIGALSIDPTSHVIYQVFDSIAANPDEARACTGLCGNNFHSVWVGVSIDEGMTFTDYPVYINSDTSVGYNHQFSQATVDKAGNVYAVYTDDHNVYYSFSTDFGHQWSGPFQVNHSPSSTAIFPWSSAGSRGILEIVWYGTSFDGTVISKQCPNKCTPDNYPSNAAWKVYFAQTLNALTTTSSFTQAAATPIIHYGGVCEAGISCTGNRDLFDDFGVAASPTTGLASIVFSDDQFVPESATDPASPTCKAKYTNMGPCDHTEIATQTSGQGIFIKPKGFEVEQEDLEESSSNKPELDIAITNTDTQKITSLSVQLNGLDMALSWNPSLPLPSGATLSASTTSLPVGLTTVIGGVYTLTVTATMSDGTTVTQTFSVIQTLVVGPF